MKREGECRRCGRCCQDGYDFIYSISRDSRGKLDYKTLKFKQAELADSSARKSCMKLTFDPETGRAICLAEDAKPEICRRYPTTAGERVFSDCGFRFIETGGA